MAMVEDEENVGNLEQRKEISLSSTPVWGHPTADEAVASSSAICSVAEMVRQAASDFISEQVLPGYVYFEEQKTYYNHETGYFFDPTTSLFYHPTTGEYYYYDEDSESYLVYAKYTTPLVWSSKRNEKMSKVYYDDSSTLTQMEVDVLECVVDLLDRCEFLADGICRQKRRTLFQRFAERRGEFDETNEFDDSIRNRPRSPISDDSSSSEDDERFAMMEAERMDQPPCIRLVEIDTQRLFIVTIMGATVGYASDCDVALSTVAATDRIANTHARFEFHDGNYSLSNMSNSYLTSVNEEFVAHGSPRVLSHEDRIVIGGRALFVHLHHGTNTCGGCEPGLMARPSTSVNQTGEKRQTREAKRRSTMRQLKAQYGLDRPEPPASRLAEGYIDRAKERQRLVGSTHDGHAKTRVYAAGPHFPVPGTGANAVPSSSANALTQENKGFKLLKSMGWKEGTGLGKDEQGIIGPIESRKRGDRVGLGMEETQTKEKKVQISKKMEILLKTKQRFDQVGKQSPSS